MHQGLNLPRVYTQQNSIFFYTIPDKLIPQGMTVLPDPKGKEKRQEVKIYPAMSGYPDLVSATCSLKQASVSGNEGKVHQKERNL